MLELQSNSASHRLPDDNEVDGLRSRCRNWMLRDRDPRDK